MLWTLALPWLPGRIEAASLERPGLGDGWLLDERGTPIPNGAFPIELARAVLDLRDDDPVILIRQHRHPARSLRGAIRYMDRLWLLRHQLDLHARRLAPSAVERVQATA